MPKYLATELIREGAANSALVPSGAVAGRVLRQVSTTPNDVAWYPVTIKEMTPFAAEAAGSSAFPQLLTINGRPALAFDASTPESIPWSFRWPEGPIGVVTFVGLFIMASATSNKVDFALSIEAVTPGDALDLDATTSYDADNTITAPTVPGTAGYLGTFTCTFSNLDSVQPGDLCRVLLRRDAADGTNDTASGDSYFLMGALIMGY